MFNGRFRCIEFENFNFKMAIVLPTKTLCKLKRQYIEKIQNKTGLKSYLFIGIQTFKCTVTYLFLA